MTMENMTEREKAREVARLLLAWADEKTLQMFLGAGKWDDYVGIVGPKIYDPSFWRVKPEPRRMWQIPAYGGIRTTLNSAEADEWKSKGEAVTEWMEVLP